MLYVYTYKRNLDGTYEAPFLNMMEPDDARREANYMVISDIDKAAESKFNLKTLCYLGMFDQEKGQFVDLKCDELIDLSVPFNQIMNLRGDGHGGKN